MRQFPFAPTLPPVSLRLVLPTANAAPALSVTVPPQELLTVALARLIWAGVAGKISLNVTPAIELAES